MSRRTRIITHAATVLAALTPLLLSLFTCGRITGTVRFCKVPNAGCAPSVAKASFACTVIHSFR